MMEKAMFAATMALIGTDSNVILIMKKRILLFLALLSFLGCGETFAQEITFSKETFSDGSITLPYRKVNIPGLDDKASLVIYLHGGSSKGNDNETQMQEPGIGDISAWLCNNNRKAVMLVPQCPTDRSWLGTTQDAVVRLLQSYIDRGVVDENKVYILGGSMGGTGTWNMLSNHSNFFAAAMPVAGNPTGLNAETVSKTPLLTVMGTADNIMKISNVTAFLAEMDKYKAEYKLNIEEGWTHEDVCKKSYTNDRLSWLFEHVKGQNAEIAAITPDDATVVDTVWFSVNGQRLSSEPKQKGVYIKILVYDNGMVSPNKCCIR